MPIISGFDNGLALELIYGDCKIIGVLLWFVRENFCEFCCDLGINIFYSKFEVLFSRRNNALVSKF